MAKRLDAVVNKIQFDSSEVDMALRKQIPEKPIFLHNRSDTCSLWECPQCKRRFATTHKPGVLDGTDIYIIALNAEKHLIGEMNNEH
nr:MAG TPA: C2H2 type zinc-finger protein [Bacteriophage sp.]